MKELVPVILAGPTASGKSSLAVALARKLGGEVVNLDPFQALAGLPILTAQPDEDERRAVPHHLYGCLPLDAELTAVRYAERVEAVVGEIGRRGRTPVLVSGSGLYLRAVSHGLDNSLPATPPELLAELSARPPAENLAELEQLDPEEAARIDRANPRRVERALALCRLLGEPVSRHRGAGPDWGAPPTRPLRGWRLDWERSTLVERIGKRARAMFKAGVEDEVAALADRALGPTATQVIGLAEVRAIFGGDLSRAEAIERLIILTRRYAKRQQTWFAKEQWMETIDCGQFPTTAATLSRLLDSR